MDAVIRFATPADADALVELRVAIFAAMGEEVGPPDAPWRRDAGRWFAARIADGTAVVAVAGSEPIAPAMAVVEHRAPSPTAPNGLVAHIGQVSTLPGHRRRGLARACLTLLLARLDADGVARADLHATTDGDSLYRSLGFRDPASPALRRPRPR